MRTFTCKKTLTDKTVVRRSLKSLHGCREALPAENEQVDDVADQSDDADDDDDDPVQRILDAPVPAVTRPGRRRDRDGVGHLGPEHE